MVKKLLEEKEREREGFTSGMLCIYVPGIFSSCVCVFFLGFALFFLLLGVRFLVPFFWGQSSNLKDFEGPVCSFWAVGLA